MRKLIVVVLAALLFVSCAVTKHENPVVGTFKGPTYWGGGGIALSISDDKTFELNWRHVDYSGKWVRLDEKHILLKFNEITDFSLFVRSGVILDKEGEVRFITKNKVEYDHTILKREK